MLGLSLLPRRRLPWQSKTEQKIRVRRPRIAQPKDKILDFIARVWRAAAAGLPADENTAAHELGLQLIDTTDQFNLPRRTVYSVVEALNRKTSTAPEVSYRALRGGEVVWMLDVNRLCNECITLSDVRGRFGEETEVIAEQNHYARGAGEFRYVLPNQRIKTHFVYVRGLNDSYLANFSIGEYRVPSKSKR